MRRGLALIALTGLATAQGTQVDRAKLDKYARDAAGRRPLVRIQAARRLVKAGAEGFAALQRFVDERGANALSSELVHAIGRFDGAKPRALLHRLVADAAFAWRPQVLLAAAERAKPEEAETFERFLEHGSWLMRRAALLGWSKSKGSAAMPTLRKALTDGDERLRVYAATLLLDRGDTSGLTALVHGLDAELDFFGDDIGYGIRQRAFAALRKWAGDDFGYSPRRGGEGRSEAIEKFAAKARDTIGKELPARPESKRHAWRLGFEQRSCKDGDLYLRVDRDGRIWRGLFSPAEIPASQRLGNELLDLSMRLPGKVPRRFGKILCDFDRYAGFGGHGKGSVRCEPGKIPPALTDLAKALRRLTAK